MKALSRCQRWRRRQLHVLSLFIRPDPEPNQLGDMTLSGTLTVIDAMSDYISDVMISVHMTETANLGSQASVHHQLLYAMLLSIMCARCG